ncbi:alpha/beta hydrolase [Pokkaliibacter sp. CJK22405]|uniref:alpha/beta hydrolase n=1 Tax=Pokkaliibacter sp. CJK22405 TaxID=3384615 RepID=UPI0039850B3C
MTAHTKDQLITEPSTGLQYRVLQQPAHALGRLILMHGVGGNESNFDSIVGLLDSRLEVLSVRGPLTLRPGSFAWFVVNFGANGPVIDEAQAEQARLKILGFIDALQDVSPLPTAVSGFSQGSIMSASAGLTAPEKIAAVGLISGRILPEIAPHLPKIEPHTAASNALLKLPVFIAHGEQDATLPIFWAERATSMLTELGVPHQFKRYSHGHEISARVIQDFNAWLVTQLENL